MLSLSQADLLRRIAAAPIQVRGVLDRPTVSRSLVGHGFIEEAAGRWRITDAGRGQFGLALISLPERIEQGQETEVFSLADGTRVVLIRAVTYSAAPTWVRVVHRGNELQIARRVEPGPWVSLVSLPDTCSEGSLHRALRKNGIMVRGPTQQKTQ